MGWRSLVAATFQPVGEEELELRIAPGTKNGLLAVQQVTEGCYQGNVRKAKRGGFVSLPSSSSSLLAAWFVAKALTLVPPQSTVRMRGPSEHLRALLSPQKLAGPRDSGPRVPWW